MTMKKIFTFSLLFLGISLSLFAQKNIIRGSLNDAKTGEALSFSTIIIKGTSEGIQTDFEGAFELKTERALPLTLLISYVGYVTKEIEVKTNKERLKINLEQDNQIMQELVVKGDIVTQKQRESAKTIEALDATQIKNVATNFYDALGNQKGVDLTTASLGFTIINTRGFNSTSPVRSLQIIDGVDNQAPGLNFSLGNFLGASELDIKKVELIVGANSAFYGPNAFNGVVSMSTKDPFFSEGLSASVKYGERNLLETAIRYAGVINNKAKQPVLGLKGNLFRFSANDWEAENYSPVTDSRTGVGNPGRFDAVNIYGDEYNISGDQTTGSRAEKIGLGIFHRTGYKEIELVDYNTKNYKANLGAYLRLEPSKGHESVILNYGFNFGQGTTVYQGENRFRLKNIQFIQHKLELRKEDKFFLRAYMTQDNAGDTYDPYATALRMQDFAKQTGSWYSNYTDYWRTTIDPKAIKLGYPQPKIIFNPDGTVTGSFDDAAADRWLVKYKDSLVLWHQIAERETNKSLKISAVDDLAFFKPGSPEYNLIFNKIISTPGNQLDSVTLPNGQRRQIRGTKFVDRSALYHVQGEYKFEPKFTDEIVVGGNFRQYTPVSDGTIFFDTAGTKITNREGGFYGGFTKKFQNGRYTLSGTMRMDKNQNYGWLPSPAASLVWTPDKGTYFRLSFSSAIRNPTLTDQYLSLNVGRALLSGNTKGVKGLITVPSFIDYLNTGQSYRVKRYDIAGVRPEKVKTIETGFRTTIREKLYIDANAYFSSYVDFIGYNIGIGADSTGGILSKIQAYRFSTNSLQRVLTSGAAIGADYALNKTYSINANYSWNTLVKTDENDPIIPSFNTPKHKFNVGFSGRDLSIAKSNNWGFKVNYKWVQGYSFEGSPQFTGYIPSFGLLDAQINHRFEKLNTTVKVGGSNLLQNWHYEVYGGPLVGRLAYVSLVYDASTKK
jgi:iron complex outermembrane recepter protein